MHSSIHVLTRNKTIFTCLNHMHESPLPLCTLGQDAQAFQCTALVYLICLVGLLVYKLQYDELGNRCIWNPHQVNWVIKFRCM